MSIPKVPKFSNSLCFFCVFLGLITQGAKGPTSGNLGNLDGLGDMRIQFLPEGCLSNLIDNKHLSNKIAKIGAEEGAEPIWGVC